MSLKKKSDSSYNEEPKYYSTFIYVDYDAPSTQFEQINQVESSHQTENDGVEMQISNQHRMVSKLQTEDVESHIGNDDHQTMAVEHSEPKLELEQNRRNEPHIVFLDEPEEESRRKLLMLEKHVSIHKKPDQIMGGDESSVEKEKTQS